MTTTKTMVSTEALRWLNRIHFDTFNNEQRDLLMETATKLFPPTREECLMNELMEILCP